MTTHVERAMDRHRRWIAGMTQPQALPRGQQRRLLWQGTEERDLFSYVQTGQI
jgi:hypothetical protein